MKRLVFAIIPFILILASCANTAPVVIDAPVYAPADTSAPDGTNDTERVQPAPIESDVVESDTRTDESAPSESVPDESYPTESRGVVYLTFDDGPYTHTYRVLEILEKYDVKAVFFLVGEHILRYPENARAIAEAGHTIACHSVSHDYDDIYESPDAMRADITAWENIVESTIGYVPNERLYRFPGGSTCSAIGKGEFDALYAAVGEKGYRVFDWTCGNNDRWDGGRREGQSVEDYLKESVKVSLILGGKPHILLLHETASATVDTLEWTIEYLLGEGYTFGELSQFDTEYIFAK